MQQIDIIEVTSNVTRDALILSCLLDQITDHKTIASINSDGTYEKKDCHMAIARRGAPAIIPTCKNFTLLSISASKSGS